MRDVWSCVGVTGDLVYCTQSTLMDRLSAWTRLSKFGFAVGSSRLVPDAVIAAPIVCHGYVEVAFIKSWVCQLELSRYVY